MLTEDLRLAAVSMIAEGSFPDEVCKVIGCKMAARTRRLWYFRETENLWPNHERRSTQEDGLQYNEELHSAMAFLIERDPTTTLRDNADVLTELATIVAEEFDGLQCSAASLPGYIHRMGSTKTVIELLFREPNDAARLSHCQLMRQIPRR